ncbi:MAG: stage sporulation protein [Bacillota bacterium]|jgi:stage II sporulation protein M
MKLLSPVYIGSANKQLLAQPKKLYLFAVVLFLSGIIIGSLIVNKLDLTQKEGLTGYLRSFFQHVNQGNIVEPQLSFQYLIGDHLKTLGLIWLLSLSVIGTPLAFSSVFLKGFLFGFNIGFFFNQFSWSGVWFACASILPQDLIIIPVYIIVVVSGMSFTITLIKNRLLFYRGSLYPQFLTFSFITMGAVPVLCLTSLFQAYVSPYIMKLFLPI